MEQTIHNTQNKPNISKHRLGFWFSLNLVILLIGIGTTIYAVHYTDNFLRASLLSRAQTIAAGVHDDALKHLSGSESDIGRDSYDDIKDGLVRIQQANPDSRFVYLMGFRSVVGTGPQLFFFADSEPSDSEDYSAPGDFYTDASEFKVKNTLAGKAFIEGPYTDEWGSWVSAYVPVIDRENMSPDGKPVVLATAGIDISAVFWRKEIAYAASLPAIITLFLLIILWLYRRSRKHQKHFIDILEKERARLRALYEITTHGDQKLLDQFRAALDLGAKTLGSSIAVLSRIENEQFTVEYAVAPPNTIHEGDVFALAETYCDITVKKGDVVSIDYMKKDKNHGHACYKKFSLEAYIGVPVSLFGELHGTLAFMAPDPHRPNFSDSDRDFVRLMGKWMSAMLERAQIDQMKSEFVSVASHQLRTPLTGIRWFGELLLKGKAGELTTDQKDFIQQMYDSNTRMINLVNDLLNVSRIDTGKKFAIEKKPTDVAPIVASLFTELVALAAQHKVTLQRTKDFPATLTLNIDEEKIRQVLQNLLSNAVKYSHEGGVVEIATDMSKKNEVIFSIKDSGLGIPAAQQKRMFEKFFRADNVQTKETEGTGLGLYIAKAIVEGHGGKIWFESVQDKGTTFIFSLPR